MRAGTLYRDAKAHTNSSVPLGGIMAKTCQKCGKRCYGDFCFIHKPRKQIKQKGKQSIRYEEWRDNIAIPFLDKTYGRICNACKGARCGNRQLDVDHILNRGSHPQLKMSLDNVQYLGRFPCHSEKTDRI